MGQDIPSLAIRTFLGDTLFMDENSMALNGSSYCPMSLTWRHSPPSNLSPTLARVMAECLSLRCATSVIVGLCFSTGTTSTSWLWGNAVWVVTWLYRAKLLEARDELKSLGQVEGNYKYVCSTRKLYKRMLSSSSRQVGHIFNNDWRLFNRRCVSWGYQQVLFS